MSDAAGKQVKQFLDLGEGRIFYELGVELARSPQMSDTPLLQQDDPERRGRLWFEKNFEAIQSAICDDWDACKKIDALEQNKDEAVLSVALLEVISTILTGIPAVLVTALILKIGLSRLCNCSGGKPSA